MSNIEKKVRVTTSIELPPDTNHLPKSRSDLWSPSPPIQSTHLRSARDRQAPASLSAATAGGDLCKRLTPTTISSSM
jgi:hypothetical protein